MRLLAAVGASYLAAVSLLGCHTGYQLVGVVKSRDGKPIAGAEVRASCAKPSHRATKSDATGRFYERGAGGFADDCRIEVSAPGYETQRFTVGSICEHHAQGLCVSIELRVTLAPKAP